MARLSLRLHKTISGTLYRYNGEKSDKSFECLGCTPEVALEFMGPRPTDGHDIDHICPCAQGRTPGEVIKLQHYTNLQWLPHLDNIKKSDKWTPEGEEMCRNLLGRDWDFNRRPQKRHKMPATGDQK